MSAALDHLAASANQTDTRIGWIFWFNVSEKPEDQNIVRAAFYQSGLPDKYSLPRIRAVDAYRRASTSIEGRVTVQDSSKIELMVRGDDPDKSEVTRTVVIEDHNRTTRELNYHPKAAILRFNRDYEMVDADVYKPEPFILDAVQKFKENYELFLKTYDGQAKRRVARSVLNDLAATSVKDTGGVYLIPRQNEDLMFQLVSYIKELPGCNAQKVPVVDTSETRDMMRDLVTQKAESMLAEIRGALKAENLPEKNVQKLLEQARQIRHEVSLYQEVLRESIGTLEVDVEILEAQMMNLVDTL